MEVFALPVWSQGARFAQPSHPVNVSIVLLDTMHQEPPYVPPALWMDVWTAVRSTPASPVNWATISLPHQHAPFAQSSMAAPCAPQQRPARNAKHYTISPVGPASPVLILLLAADSVQIQPPVSLATRDII